jgi:hypothetical protein
VLLAGSLVETAVTSAGTVAVGVSVHDEKPFLIFEEFQLAGGEPKRGTSQRWRPPRWSRADAGGAVALGASGRGGEHMRVGGVVLCGGESREWVGRKHGCRLAVS